MPSLRFYAVTALLALPQLQGQVLLLHGERDTLIAPSHSLRLLALLPSARRVLVAGAAHNDLQDFAGYGDALAKALAALR